VSIDIPATERLDEELMAGGLGWREAASISNEAAGGEYAIWGRAQRAEDIAQARKSPLHLDFESGDPVRVQRVRDFADQIISSMALEDDQ
jgi:hypothetical protein